ncbi:uncharacterized protein LOC126281887 [Schistocerca gregaria]|uniref:uncharacterized protein LOC126281887 n=1 Tax=Schistocerca gregaria TaxID=7010 RepID=UPI00211E6F67|nr:uncharacterized protein LOC126281887 [Schistocerca gregaria]
MDGSEQESTNSELSDSWMVINDTAADKIKDNGTPSDGSDGESVEVIDQEECDEVLSGELDYDVAQTDEEVNGPKNKKYVHHPNKDVNTALNILMVIAASVVVGLAVGHYLGYSEEVNDMGTRVKKLEAENFKLKNHICLTLKNYDNHIMHITGNDYTELKHFNENYGVFLTVLLNLTCPHTEAKVSGFETSLNDLRQDILNGHISDDELHDRIGNLLRNRSKGDEVIDYMNSPEKALHSEGGTITTQGKGHTATASQMTETVTVKGCSSQINAYTESVTVKTQEERISKTKIHEHMSRTSIPESTQVRVGGEAETRKSALSEELIGSLAKSPSKISISTSTHSSERCKAATDSKDSPVSTENTNKSMLKHIVKDVVQEITESVLSLHHDDIRNIRNEAKRLMQSFPIFKSALLLNMEATTKLKSHLQYIKDMLYSVLENSPLMTDKRKIDEIFSSVNFHALHLEKAMDSLQVIEVTLNPKGSAVLNAERSNVCTVSDFIDEVFINYHHNIHPLEHYRKHPNSPHEENNMYTATETPSHKKVIDDPTVEVLSQKSAIERHGKISNFKKLPKIETDDKFVTQHRLHSKLRKYEKRLTREIKKEKNKKKQDHDKKKYKKSKQQSAETRRNNGKDEWKHKDFKKMKEKYHDQRRNLKKQYHYKEEKHFKSKLYDTRKKNTHNIYKWNKDEDYRHSNMSGDWVIDMSRARAESRENEHKSDWLFERAYARKAKRNGKWDMNNWNNWYFQRAEGRKSCRQKSGSEYSKITDPPPNESEKEYHDNNSKQYQKQRKYFKPKRWISKAYMTVSKFRF